MNNNHELTDAFEINFIELRKAPKEGRQLKELWLRFIAAESEAELDTLSKEDPIMEEALEKLKYFSSDDQLRYELDMREKWEFDHLAIETRRYREGKAEGEAKGRAAGKAEGKAEIFRNMREAGFSDDDIERVRELGEWS